MKSLVRLDIIDQTSVEHLSGIARFVLRAAIVLPQASFLLFVPRDTTVQQGYRFQNPVFLGRMEIQLVSGESRIVRLATQERFATGRD